MWTQSTKIIVMSADGRERSIRALELLDEAGYNTLVGLKVRARIGSWSSSSVGHFFLSACRLAPQSASFPHLQGGFLLWNMTWDNKLNRRVYTEYKEDYYHEADSCGIHASGAGFSKMDPLEFRTEIIH